MSVSNRGELVAEYAAGVPVRQLATRFNVHRGTVREIARQAGLAARRPELSDVIRQDAARLYAAGMTLAQVATQLGIESGHLRPLSPILARTQTRSSSSRAARV
ncbi:helix-turn-helix domain-containing protein [Luethyella okanaganae]|uniref:Helix-turn-helix domain-containing protein n=1 Tax=Luethyella okanaganae TaxID=69372 RepID=A0ABW1VG70_9MICO